MSSPTRRRGLVLGATLACLVPSSAQAEPWRPLTPANQMQNQTQPGVSRDAAGVLHVVWGRDDSTLSGEELLHTAIAPDGTIGAPSPIVTGWSTIGLPDVVATPGGLLAIISGYVASQQPNIATAKSTDGGATWAVDTSKLVRTVQGEPSLTAGADGTPFVAFGHVRVQRSFQRPAPEAPDPSYDYHATHAPGVGCCGNSPDIDRDDTGRVWLSWYSNDKVHPGNHVWQVDAGSGAPVGPALVMPGSSTTFQGAQESIQPHGRAAIARQTGTPNMYTVARGGYPNPTNALVWRVGTPKPVNLTKKSSERPEAIRAMTVTGAPDGRMWVVWDTGITDSLRIHARRSNKAGTRWGAETLVRPPKDSVDTYTLDASVAPSGGLDVLGRFSFVNAENIRQDSAPYLTRLLPTLTLTASPAKIRAGRKTTVRLRVTDAFDPVKGATVKVGSERAVTDGGGRASLRLEPSRNTRSLRAVASAPGYADGIIGIRVVRK